MVTQRLGHLSFMVSRAPYKCIIVLIFAAALTSVLLLPIQVGLPARTEAQMMLPLIIPRQLGRCQTKFLELAELTVAALGLAFPYTSNMASTVRECAMPRLKSVSLPSAGCGQLIELMRANLAAPSTDLALD